MLLTRRFGNDRHKKSPQGLPRSRWHWPYCLELSPKPSMKDDYITIWRRLGATSEAPNMFVNFSLNAGVISVAPSSLFIGPTEGNKVPWGKYAIASRVAHQSCERKRRKLKKGRAKAPRGN